MGSSGIAARTLESGAGHADLERRFMELVDRIRSEDWTAVDELWPELAADFEGHLVFEERDMFPRYCADEPSRRSQVRRLLVDHMDLRGRVAELGRLLAERSVTAESIGTFWDALSAHSQREDRTVYAWLASRHAKE